MEPSLASKGRIIVVEDNTLCLSAFSAYLEARGFSVSGFNSCGQALEFLTNPHPPVLCIFADLHLEGGLPGVEWLMALKEAAHGVPVIVVTGDTTPEGTSIAVKAGYPVLIKPFTPQVVKLILDSITDGHPLLTL